MGYREIVQKVIAESCGKNSDEVVTVDDLQKILEKLAPIIAPVNIDDLPGFLNAQK